MLNLGIFLLQKQKYPPWFWYSVQYRLKNKRNVNMDP